MICLVDYNVIRNLTKKDYLAMMEVSPYIFFE